MSKPEVIKISKELMEIIPVREMFSKTILPVSLNSGNLVIAGTNSDDRKLIDDLGFETGYQISIDEYPSDFILNSLKHNFPDYTFEKKKKSFDEGDKNYSEYSNIEFVNQVIENAVKNAVSDIHFETLENSFRIRYRLDGHLNEVYMLPKDRSMPVASRIKIMAGLDIAEKRRPQDGRIKITILGRNIDIRVSTLPTNFGEKIVLRILDKTQLNLDLKKLGLNDSQLELLKTKINSPYGMILVTGPTGSGKTTTLYAALQNIHSVEKNILTVEDPIEYNLQGINQCNVKQDIGFNFASALRSFLRQDPDVIMVGEIRDKETAEIAIRASLTGHLVFSTLHTNDAVSCINRLIDMGVENYLVSSSVKLIIAQRLIRTLCDCKIISDVHLPYEIIGDNKHYQPNGCEKCNYSGYKGRTAIYEMLEIDEEIEKMISKKESTQQIKEILVKKNYTTLNSAGIEKIKKGISTYEEVLRETIV